jgi:hypothetical protein
MADKPKLAAKARRERRLQAALRENLKRRKAQARGRAGGRPLDDEEPEPTEEIVRRGNEKAE